MEEKYIKFYKKFILQTKTLNDSRIGFLSELHFELCLPKTEGHLTNKKETLWTAW